MAISTIDERLEALAREDKWYLSCGDGLLWAPPFPHWLERPGFWDEAQLYDHAFAPLFSVALVGPDGREIALRQKSRRWRPDYMDLVWQAASGPDLVERRYALPGGRLSSLWRTADGGLGPLATAHLVAFTAQPGQAVRADSVAETGSGLRFSRRLLGRRGAELWVEAALGAELPPAAGRQSVRVRRAALRSEGAVAQPCFALTPFLERWQRDGLREELRLQGISERGLVFLAVAAPLQDVAGAGGQVVFSIDLVPAESFAAPGAERVRTRPDASQNPTTAWRSFLESFPAFTCSDPFLARYYDYRVYGLRLNRLEGGIGPIGHASIAEGIGVFHQPISYSAQCHMLEMRWSRDPTVARGSLLNFLDNQAPDGSFHGRLHTQPLASGDFYHANWGDAVLAVEAVHPSREFLSRAYEGLVRYVLWLDASRDAEDSGLVDVIDQRETGQEYATRYLAVDQDADRYGWENRIRLKGIDACVYAYQLKRALAVMAERLGITDRPDWRAEAGRVGRAILGRAWDEASGLFSDVDPRSLARTGVKAAVSFYPLLTDLLGPGHVRRLLEHLENPREFATSFPVPTSSRDDPNFSPDAEWKGKRHLCPWNGRVWPMTNSHLLEGLLRQWQAGRREVGPFAARFLARFVRMMFHDGDLARPNCHEHYNPLTGRASVYRGIDDYMHSWVLDLLIRGVAGLQPTLAGLRVDPLPGAAEEASLTGALLAGRSVSVHRKGDEVVLELDGEVHATKVGTPLEIAF